MQLKPRKRPGLVDEIWFQNMIWGRYYRTISEPAYYIYEWHLDIKIKITCLYTLWILHLEICNILNSQEVHYKLECVWRNDYCQFPCQSSRRSFSVLLIQSQQGQGMFSVTTALLVLNWWQWTAVDALSICVSTYCRITECATVRHWDKGLTNSWQQYLATFFNTFWLYIKTRESSEL